MRDIPVNTQALLEAGALVTRDFLRITARVRDTNEPVTEGFWSGNTDVSAQVLDANTGVATGYPFTGVGPLIAVDAIPMVSNLTVQEVQIHFSQLEERVEELLRVYDLRQASVEIYRGEFDPDRMVMVEPASSRFVGFVDGAPVETPAEGGTGSVMLSCVSTAQELTRGNPDMRSHESQQVRSPGDDFFQDVTVVPDLTIFWGRRGSVSDTPTAT